MEAAIKQWAEVYTNVLLAKEVKPYNFEVAISYAVQDMLNMVKNYSLNDAILTIIDDAEWMQEKLDKEVNK